MNDDVFSGARRADLLVYRKAAIATVGAFLDLDDAFIDAVLDDRMDDFLEANLLVRETMKSERYSEYLSMLAREAIVRYAATAAEALAADPEATPAPRRGVGDANGLGKTDEVNAMVRVHELLECVEWPAHGEEGDRALASVKRQLCNYYSVSAHELVRGQLLRPIVTIADALFRGKRLVSRDIRDAVIAQE